MGAGGDRPNYAMDHLAGPHLQARATLDGYATAYSWAAAFFAAGALVTLLLFRRKRDSQPSAVGAHMPRPRAAVATSGRHRRPADAEP